MGAPAIAAGAAPAARTASGSAPLAGAAGLPMPLPAPDDGAAGFDPPDIAAKLLAGALGALLALILLIALPALLVTSILRGDSGQLGDGAGLPAGAQPFRRTYEDAARTYRVSPFLLMATHEAETTFSTSRLPGVRSGVNFAGCCAGPMQFYIRGAATPTQGGSGATWAAHRTAYRRAALPRPAAYPGRFTRPDYPTPNVYDSYDALYAAARYFHELGAGPQLDQRTFNALVSYGGTPPASIPYATARYERAKELQRVAAQNTGPYDASVTPAFGRDLVRVARTSPWLGAVPGFPGEQCDRRILPNLVYLIRRYRLAVTDCYSLSSVHKTDGEHPLGLGADLVPGPGGSWDLVDQLAAAAEPSQNHPRPPFRWVGYNGDDNHGRGNHLHLSWQHAPAAYNTQADWVLVAR